MKNFLLMIAAALFASCNAQSPAPVKNDTALRYVALGDSYTICEGTTREHSWPLLLANDVTAKGTPLQLVANPSRTGWTTQDLIDRELPVFDTSRADAVTLLIGVNDWVQGVTKENFRRNLAFILDHVQSKLKKKTNVLLITIPDFGVTPTGKFYSGGRNIPEGIASFNDVIKAEGKARGLRVVDIFPLSKGMGKDDSLVAEDGLHPSASEYLLWEKLILPEMVGMLRESEG